MSSGAGEGAQSSHYKQTETPAGDKKPYYKENRRGGYRKDYQPRYATEYHPKQEETTNTTEGGAEFNYNFDAVYTAGENGGHYKERKYSSRGG